MQLPKRVQNHITETASYKIFSRCIPDHWIIRDITERDYGIDCYIELVTANNEVTGELISIQLKGTQSIDWTNEDTHSFYGVKIPTTNYWNNFPVPVFICLVDTGLEEVYFCPVKSFIRSKYLSYIKQTNFNYQFSKSNRLQKELLSSFLKFFYQEKKIHDMEKNLTTFITHYKEYQDFILENTHRDVFMGVESSRILYLKHFYQNIEFLSTYFGLGWDIPRFEQFCQKSRNIFGNHYDLYEQQMHEVVTLLELKLLPILLKIRDHVVNVEEEYWRVKDITLLNVMINVSDEGDMPIDW